MKKLLALLLALLGFAATSCDRGEYRPYYSTRVATFEEKEMTDEYLSEMPSEQAMRDEDFVKECVVE